MDNENYIVINGQKAELTEKQLEALGIEVSKKSAFDRRELEDAYYFIRDQGDVVRDMECNWDVDNDRYNVANYCTDKAIMEQRALHEMLNRLLWRFSMEHDGDKIDWNSRSQWKFYVKYDHIDRNHCVKATLIAQGFEPYFYTKIIAERAIEEIIKPFIAKCPEFKW